MFYFLNSKQNVTKSFKDGLSLNIQNCKLTVSWDPNKDGIIDFIYLSIFQ